MNLVEKIFNSGVIGAGGAGFPTHIKYKSKADHLIINGAECEPIILTDQYQMLHNADEIISGMKIAKEYLEVEKLTLVIKGEFTPQIKALKEEGEKQNLDFKIVEEKTFYPAGDEHSVIYAATKEALAPGKLPIEMGLIVSNVGTMRNIYQATKDIPVTRKIITVAGEVKEPKIIEVPVGTSIEKCLDLAGGTNIQDYHIIIGGPMMGKMIKGTEAKDTFVTKTTGGILVFKSSHQLVTRKLQSIEHIRNQTSSACIHCTFCTELCPRYLKGHPLRPHEVMVAFGQGNPNHPDLAQADLCCECGICELYSCPMGLSPRIVCAEVKKENRKLKKEKKEWKSEGVRDVEKLRRLPTDRLSYKIDVSEYRDNNDLEFKSIPKSKIKKVRIMLNQHIGKPATPIVKVGDKVKEGDLIADLKIDDIGALVHSSIDGTVTQISNNFIEIEGDSI